MYKRVPQGPSSGRPSSPTSTTTRRSSPGPPRAPRCGSTTRRRASRSSPPPEEPTPASWSTRANCYICKAEYPAGRRVLPLAVPRLRRAEPHQARTAHRPHRQAGAAHRGPREDRDVHRAAAPARRRTPHHHHTVPARRGETLLRHKRIRLTGSTGSRWSASTCATPRRSSRWPTRSLPQARSTSWSTTPAQTVRRSPGSYSHLVDGESVPLEGDVTYPELVTFDRISEAHPRQPARHPAPVPEGGPPRGGVGAGGGAAPLAQRSWPRRR